MKEIGRISQLTVEEDAEGFLFHVANVLGWSEEEVHVYAADFRNEIRSKKYRPYFYQSVVWGRKPL